MAYLERLRQQFIDTKDKTLWYDLIRLLPCAYLQLRTCTLNYEVLRGIVEARRIHKLDEWHQFCDWALSLPYGKELLQAE